MIRPIQYESIRIFTIGLLMDVVRSEYSNDEIGLIDAVLDSMIDLAVEDGELLFKSPTKIMSGFEFGEESEWLVIATQILVAVAVDIIKSGLVLTKENVIKLIRRSKSIDRMKHKEIIEEIEKRLKDD